MTFPQGWPFDPVGLPGEGTNGIGDGGGGSPG
jgi:hypothetical protein